MTRTTLILLLGLSMLFSFSVQAGGRDGHYNRHHAYDHDKHRGHHNKHYRQHYYSHGKHRYACQHGSHYRNGRVTQFYAEPHYASYARYGYLRQIFCASNCIDQKVSLENVRYVIE
jgi:hypothetical protein